MPAGSPPFRADHVGSLLRPPEITQARARKAELGFGAAELAAVEDAAIRRAIARQQEVGLAAVTDGEFRRAAWHWDFLSGFQGVETATASTGVSFKGATTAPTLIRIVGPPAFGPHPMLEHFAFVKRNTSAVAKMCIPSPTHFVGVVRDWRTVVNRKLYPELDACSSTLLSPIAMRSGPLPMPAAAIFRSTIATSHSCATLPSSKRWCSAAMIRRPCCGRSPGSSPIRWPSVRPA